MKWSLRIFISIGLVITLHSCVSLKEYKKLEDKIINLENRLQDQDSDGVPDAIDLEPNTHPAATVDVKGRTLDSDRDGVPDYQDKEPYSIPREGEFINPEGIIVNRKEDNGGITEERVIELIDQRLTPFYQTTTNSGTDTDNSFGMELLNLFLKPISFKYNSATITLEQYDILQKISRVLKASPEIRLVVEGHADRSSSELADDILSYNRAEAVVNHLVENHGVPRGKLVLHWTGGDKPLYPGNHALNRRVEFKVATPNDVEMDPPVDR